MKARYLSLLTLKVTHQYYGSDDAICPDFDFVLAEHSQQALRGARLLARTHGGRLHVLFEADENNLPMQEIDGIELIIGLRLRNPYFEHFTDSIPEPSPLYTNTSDSNALTAAHTSALIEHFFTPRNEVTGRPLVLEIRRMRDSALMWSGIVQDLEEMPNIDMRRWGAGCYQVIEQSGGTSKTSSLVLAPDLAAAGVWGAVRIVITPDFLDPASTPAPRDFYVSFNARKDDHLEYYVVGKGDLGHLSVVDTTNNSAPLEFDKFEQNELPPNTIAPMLFGIANAHAVLFQSKTSVQRSATASRHIELRRNRDQQLVKNLPLPGPDMPLARFVVHLS